LPNRRNNMILDAIKIFLPTTLTFIIGIAITPLLTDYMYQHKLWKKNNRAQEQDITNAHFSTIHDGTAEVSTPRVGGVIIWLSVLICISAMWIISKVFPSDLSHKLDFFSKNQTLVPLASLLLGSLIGLADDLLQVRGTIGGKSSDVLGNRYVKVAMLTAIGLFVSSWFYFKLAATGIAIPFIHTALHIGIFFIPFFIIVLLAVFSTSVIDGLDGLAGGCLAIVFAAYAVIAFGQHQIDIAALCGVISGGILAFLWFNIPPARFYMGETGMIGLTVVLTVIAFLTNTVLLLPIIALPLTATTVSVILQVGAYKYCGKRRVFKIAPLHHHFRALGWSKEKVVMRYWIVSIISAIIGVVLVLISK
jgi:phospho-N-acetylmuramoyl-pentapeptide-transferase